jgi:hypothetical protein
MSKTQERDLDVPREMIRAAQGERMWVLLNHVKADKLEQHKHFVQDILMPAAEKINPAVFRHTRFLYPAEPNEDGTFTSVFLMDPLLEDADYTFLGLLTEAYGEGQAKEYLKLWEEAAASPQVGYTLTQAP